MYKAGNRCTVVTVGSDGKELGSLYFSKEILDTSSAGGYVAVLTANGMDLFDKSMERARVWIPRRARRRCWPARTGRWCCFPAAQDGCSRPDTNDKTCATTPVFGLWPRAARYDRICAYGMIRRKRYETNLMFKM